MKKILLVVLGLVAGSASFANTNDDSKPTANVFLVNNDKVRLLVAPMDAKGRLDLTDAQGHVLYTNNMYLGQGLRQIFDISKLESGSYELSISVGHKRTVKSIDISEAPVKQLITVEE